MKPRSRSYGEGRAMLAAEELHPSVVVDDLPDTDHAHIGAVLTRRVLTVFAALPSAVAVLLKYFHAPHHSAKEMISYA
jgi:hypothetical protein